MTVICQVQEAAWSLYNELHSHPIVEDHGDIDSDYQTIINMVKTQHRKRNKNNEIFCNQDIIRELYEIKNEEIMLEKEWMRNLRKRKFRIYVNKNKSRQYEMKRFKISAKLNELSEQIELFENTQKVDTMTNEVERLKKEKCILIENVTKQIDSLRDIIRNLNRLHKKKNSFISVASP